MRIVCSADTFVRYENVNVSCSSGTETRQDTVNLFYCVYEDPDGTPANAPSNVQIQGTFLSTGCDAVDVPVNYNLTISAGTKSGTTEYKTSYWDNCGDPDRVTCPDNTVVEFSGFTVLSVTPTPTATNTPTPTRTPTPTPTQTINLTPSSTPTNTPTPSVTSSNTPTPSITPTNTPTPSNSPIYDYNLVNECGSFTVFPLGVTYTSQNPQSSVSNDGSITIIPTGGTSPYNYYWVGGQRTQTISNLPAGNYSVTVVDFYGDFSADTTITLFAPSPTPTSSPTPTPTITPSPSYPNLCLNVAFTNEVIQPIQFTFNGFYNNKLTWVSGSYNIIWNNNRWEISNLSYYGGKLISNTTSNIPDNGWFLVGSNETANVLMTQGACTNSPLSLTVQVNNTKCNNFVDCNGSVIINAVGGNSPYVYSLSNGVSYQSSPIFNYLCEGTYVASVLDSSGVTANKIISILYDGSQTDYQVTISEISSETIGVNTLTKSWKVNISPELPVGVYAIFNIDISENTYIYEPGSGETVITSYVYKNSVPVAPFNTITGSSATSRPNCAPNSIKNPNKFKSHSITMGRGDVVSGVTTSYLNITNPQTASNGCSTKLEQDVFINLTALKSSGCSCCNFVTNNQAVKLENHIVDLTNTNVTPSGTLYPAQFKVGNSEINICSEITIYGFINSPIFVPGVTIYSTSQDILYGYSYINYGSNIYNLNSATAVVGQPTGDSC